METGRGERERERDARFERKALETENDHTHEPKHVKQIEMDKSVVCINK